jgi:hypothetical protein
MLDERDYNVFILGYDLLLDDIKGLECDLAFDLCLRAVKDFEKSAFNRNDKSCYECLQDYVEYIKENKILNEMIKFQKGE